MAISLSNFVNNLAKKIHKIQCKYRCGDEKCGVCGIKYKYFECFLEYTNVKDNLIKYKCLCCNKIYQKNTDENLKETIF